MQVVDMTEADAVVAEALDIAMPSHLLSEAKVWLLLLLLLLLSPIVVAAVVMVAIDFVILIFLEWLSFCFVFGTSK